MIISERDTAVLVRAVTVIPRELKYEKNILFVAVFRFTISLLGYRILKISNLIHNTEFHSLDQFYVDERLLKNVWTLLITLLFDANQQPQRCFLRVGNSQKSHRIRIGEDSR